MDETWPSQATKICRVKPWSYFWFHLWRTLSISRCIQQGKTNGLVKSNLKLNILHFLHVDQACSSPNLSTSKSTSPEPVRVLIASPSRARRVHHQCPRRTGAVGMADGGLPVGSRGWIVERDRPGLRHQGRCPGIRHNCAIVAQESQQFRGAGLCSCPAAIPFTGYRRDLPRSWDLRGFGDLPAGAIQFGLGTSNGVRSPLLASLARSLPVRSLPVQPRPFDTRLAAGSPRRNR
jgi:hypothetical protein